MLCPITAISALLKYCDLPWRREGSQENDVAKYFSEVLKSMSFKAEPGWKGIHLPSSANVFCNMTNCTEHSKCLHCDSKEGHSTAPFWVNWMCRWAAHGAWPNCAERASCDRQTHTVIFSNSRYKLMRMVYWRHFSVANIYPFMLKLFPYSYSCWLLLSLLQVCDYQC